MARKTIKRSLARFFVMLDSEGVELFQWLFYVIIAFDGYNNLFLADNRPLTLLGTMGYPYFDYWCVLEMVAPSCCLFGRALYNREGFREASNKFQLAGDLILGMSEAGYVIATFHTEPVGKGGHGGYLGLAFMLSALLLGVRDWRRIRVDRWVRAKRRWLDGEPR